MFLKKLKLSPYLLHYKIFISRLQEHLVKAEETHTEDYLIATRSEQDLRAEVATLREQVLSTNQSLDSVR